MRHCVVVCLVWLLIKIGFNAVQAIKNRKWLHLPQISRFQFTICTIHTSKQTLKWNNFLSMSFLDVIRASFFSLSSIIVICSLFWLHCFELVMLTVCYFTTNSVVLMFNSVKSLSLDQQNKNTSNRVEIPCISKPKQFYMKFEMVKWPFLWPDYNPNLI